MFVVLPDHIAHLVGDLADDLGIGADHPELHREANRRPEIEAIDAHPRFGQRAFVDRLSILALIRSRASTSLATITISAKASFGSAGLKPEPEARRALADIGRVGRNIVIALEQAFRLLHRFSVTLMAVPSGSRS